MVDRTSIKKVDATLKLNALNEEIIEIVLLSKTYEINFTKEDQSYLRDFFKACIESALTENFEFEFKEDLSVKNEIVIRVARSYINDLNKEMKNCLEEINKSEDE